MSEELKITDKDTFLLFEYSGPFSALAGKKTVDAMLQECVARGHTRILLDCRGITGDMRVMDRFEVADYGQVLGTSIAKMAMVTTEAMQEPDGFVENVARNRGVNLTMFTDFDEAVRWLNQEHS